MRSVLTVSSSACVRALMAAGFTVKRANEKGTALTRDGRLVFVPAHERLSADRLGFIMFAARLSPEAFAVLLDAVPPSDGPRGAIDPQESKADEPPTLDRPYEPTRRQ
jgi:hypothetical protein